MTNYPDPRDGDHVPGFFPLHRGRGMSVTTPSYFEEEAVYSDTDYLAGVDNGTHANVPAPRIAIDYWKLAPDTRLRDGIVAVGPDEAHPLDGNHRFSDQSA
jgi:hypothetical protein